MSITDELRGYALLFKGSATHASLDLIADRIDTELEGYIELPKDADGQVWTGKERVFVADNGSRYDMRYLMFDGNDWLIDSSNGGFPVGCCRHAQPDSWERIIEDACDMTIRCCDDDAGKAELVERCKRLAGERA